MEEIKLDQIIKLLEKQNKISELILEHLEAIYKDMPMDKNTENLESNINKIKNIVEYIAENLTNN